MINESRFFFLVMRSISKAIKKFLSLSKLSKIHDSNLTPDSPTHYQGLSGGPRGDRPGGEESPDEHVGRGGHDRRLLSPEGAGRGVLYSECFRQCRFTALQGDPSPRGPGLG